LAYVLGSIADKANMNIMLKLYFRSERNVEFKGEAG